ncbi:MAG: NUDIX domain-containing protein [Candidatus Staskawiczbacteria bacterium]|jgi:8-oxo-dGTP pyrophosphatase MutT (NUDIX family)
MPKERHKIVPASYLVLIRDGRILLQRRFNTGYEDGSYSLVAGHVEKGETFTQCIIREVKEEIGISLSPEDLKVIHMMHRYSGPEWKNLNERMDVFFSAEKWEGDIENKEPNKCDDLSWFDLNKLPDNVIPYIRQAIECIKNNTFYSEHGWQ